MKILLVSATKYEIDPLLKKFTKLSVRPKVRTPYSIGVKENISSYHFGKHSMDVLITGVGMAATAFHLGKTLNKKYDLAINAGIAGSFRRNIPPGTVVNVTNDCFADFGAENGTEFLTAEEMGLVQGSRFKVRSLRNKYTDNLPKVKAITVNTVHGNAASIKKAVKKFNPDIESMEGAAFFLACRHEKISCVQIRAVSNYVERRNKKNWKMDLSVNHLSEELLKILCALS